MLEGLIAFLILHRMHLLSPVLLSEHFVLGPTIAPAGPKRTGSCRPAGPSVSERTSSS